jgi:hypothetical protein
MGEKNPQTRDPLTRREYVKYGGAVVGGSLLAGCAGDSDPATSSTETDTPTATDEPTTTESSSYAVQIAPVGEVTFDETSEEWIAYQYASGDMGVTLGQADGYLGTNNHENYPDFFYDELPSSRLTPRYYRISGGTSRRFSVTSAAGTATSTNRTTSSSDCTTSSSTSPRCSRSKRATGVSRPFTTTCSTP